MATMLMTRMLMRTVTSGLPVGPETTLRAIALPFTLRAAYPWLALVSGGLGVLVALYLILARITRRRRPTR